MDHISYESKTRPNIFQVEFHNILLVWCPNAKQRFVENLSRRVFLSLKICLNCQVPFWNWWKTFLLIDYLHCKTGFDMLILHCGVMKQIQLQSSIWSRFNSDWSYEVFLLMDGIVHFWCFKIWMLRTFKTGQFLISNGHRQCFLNQDDINWIENCQNMFDRRSLIYTYFIENMLQIYC